MRPRGMPPMPSARSSDSAPVGMPSTLHLRALVPHPHDGALAELALDLGQRAGQGGVAGLAGLGCAHGVAPRVKSLVPERRMMVRRSDGTESLPGRV